MKHATAIMLVTLVGCAAPAPTVAPVEAPPAAPVAAPIDSAASDRAAALIEDMQRRESAQAKFDRDNPAPQPRPEDLLQALRAASAPQPTAGPATVAAVTSAPSAPAPITAPSSDRDERWWKNEMRNAEVRLDENIRRLQEARDQHRMASDQMSLAVKASPAVFAETQNAVYRANAEVQRLQAEVRNDNAAVERIREDARRANVPPGWLRWP